MPVIGTRGDIQVMALDTAVMGTAGTVTTGMAATTGMVIAVTVTGDTADPATVGMAATADMGTAGTDRTAMATVTGVAGIPTVATDIVDTAITDGNCWQVGHRSDLDLDRVFGRGRCECRIP